MKQNVDAGIDADRRGLALSNHHGPERDWIPRGARFQAADASGSYPRFGASQRSTSLTSMRLRRA